MIGEFDVGLLAGASTSRSIIRWELTRIYDQLASDTPHYHIMVKACLSLSKPEEKFLHFIEIILSQCFIGGYNFSITRNLSIQILRLHWPGVGGSDPTRFL